MKEQTRVAARLVLPSPGTTLRIRAEAFGHTTQMPLRSLEIIGHGKVLAQAPAGSNEKLSVNFDLPADHGIWIAAKTTAGNGDVAHTTPVYVTVSGGGFHNPATARDRVDTAARYLTELEQDLARPGTALDNQASRHRAQLERQIAEARAVLKNLDLR